MFALLQFASQEFVTPYNGAGGEAKMLHLCQIQALFLGSLNICYNLVWPRSPRLCFRQNSKPKCCPPCLSVFICLDVNSWTQVIISDAFKSWNSLAFLPDFNSPVKLPVDAFSGLVGLVGCLSLCLNGTWARLGLSTDKWSTVWEQAWG